LQNNCLLTHALIGKAVGRIGAWKEEEEHVSSHWITLRGRGDTEK
jgi:hypothetical protein